MRTKQSVLFGVRAADSNSLNGNWTLTKSIPITKHRWLKFIDLSCPSLIAPSASAVHVQGIPACLVSWRPFASPCCGRMLLHVRGRRSEVVTPKRQPCLGREPIGNARNYEGAVKQNPLLCTEFHEPIPLHHPEVRICSDIPRITPVFSSRKLFPGKRSPAKTKS